MEIIIKQQYFSDTFKAERNGWMTLKKNTNQPNAKSSKQPLYSMRRQYSNYREKTLKHQKLRFSGQPTENWHGNYMVKMVKK